MIVPFNWLCGIAQWWARGGDLLVSALISLSPVRQPIDIVYARVSQRRARPFCAERDDTARWPNEMHRYLFRLFVFFQAAGAQKRRGRHGPKRPNWQHRRPVLRALVSRQSLLVHDAVLLLKNFVRLDCTSKVSISGGL